MDRRAFIRAGAGVCLVGSRIARAQPSKKIPTIAFLSEAGGQPTPAGLRLLDAFRERMSEHGYADGRNVLIEVNFADGNFSRLIELAADLARRKIDVILPIATPATYASKLATSTIPIVMTGAFDAQVTGLVTNLARPGGNITGLTIISSELIGKRLQLLREVAPGLLRMGCLARRVPDLGSAQHEFGRLNLGFDTAVSRGVDAAAQALGISMQQIAANGPDEIASAFTAFAKAQVGGLLVLEAPALMLHRALIADLALQRRWPTISGSPFLAQAGGLMGYGADLSETFRRAADYVDKILKGARPGDLPVGQPTKFELVINLKTAKALGITIPQSLLLRTDAVIE